MLQAAFEEIHRHGFQAASLNRILSATGLTKGALYHHFGNKQQLGYAVLDELIAPRLRMLWITPLQSGTDDPLRWLAETIRAVGEEISDGDVELGCPLNNLAQEMSPVDEGFRRRLDRIFDEWRDALSGALADGKRRAVVRSDVDEQATAAFLVAALEGCLGTSKTARDRQLLGRCGQGLMHYLESLRATGDGRGAAQRRDRNA